MKKLLIISLAAITMASCSINRAAVKTTAVSHPTIETTTMASLDISKKRISYTYTPTITDSKNLSERALMQNAIFKALEANGNADVLVQVNSMTTVRKGLLGKRVKTIVVSGYPAYYVDFREPSEMDLQSVSVFKGIKAINADGESTSVVGGFFQKLFNR